MSVQSPPNAAASPLLQVPVERWERGGADDGEDVRDWVVVEEPLQIRLDGEPLAVTMRTPGHDRELVAGFLLSEGVIDGPDDLESIESATDPFASPHPENEVHAVLRPDSIAAREREERVEQAGRDFQSVSACGVCGKKTIASLCRRLPPIRPLDPPIDLIRALPGRMRPRQRLFDQTGGLHAAALFDVDGELLALFEDIGRHNAVDKLIGHYLLRGEAPLENRILVSSGRAGFEVVQKALRGGIPVLAAVGAASSMAVETAREAGMTLYSFVGSGRANRHVAGKEA